MASYAADQNSSIAQDTIAKMYEKGVGVKQDYAEAYFWRLLATSPGDQGIDNILGRKPHPGAKSRSRKASAGMETSLNSSDIWEHKLN